MIRTPLRNSKGENTSGIYGFVKMLLKLLKDYKPDAVAIAFDVSRKTFRSDLYPEYKANREKLPDELKEQMPKVQELVALMGLPCLAIPDFEADDIIGTLSKQLRSEHEIVIFTGDKDLYQLVDDKVKALTIIKGVSETRLLDREGVKEVKGVYPEQIPDYLAIVGDSSDNIPGVKGIGEKGAESLLATYPTLESIYEHIDEITGATKKKLEESREIAFLSKRLAVISRDMDIKVDLDFESMSLERIFNADVLAKLKDYGMNSIVNEIKAALDDTPVSVQIAPPKEGMLFGEAETSVKPGTVDETIRMDGSYRLITSRKELNMLLMSICRNVWMSVDFETTSDVPVNAEIIGIAVSLKEKEGVYIPLKHEVAKEFDAAKVMELFKPLFEDKNIKKIGQNLKYECEVLLNYGIVMQGVEFDTMIAGYLIDPTRTQYNMDIMALNYLNYSTVHYTDVVADPKKMTLLDVPIEQVVNYAGEDADITLRLRNYFEPKLTEKGLTEVFRDVDMPLVQVLARMEHTGIRVDTEHLKNISTMLDGKIATLQTQIYELAGGEFNINSTKQLGEILYGKLGLAPVKFTKGKAASTDEETLTQLADEHELPKAILEYRTYAKLKNTYVDTLPEMINPKTGRIHTSFNQTGTMTGRLSSSDPNLQNIPIRDEIGREIRKAFVADAGKVLVSADYSQIELRLFAHFSQDVNMIQAFRDGIDIHSQTASLMFGIPVGEVDSSQRRAAKTINYGISYGMGPFRLSKELGISMTEAKQFIENYFANFPGIREFMNRTLEYAYKNGEVRTILGRMRPVSELKGKERGKMTALSRPERYAINTVVQGTAADIMKIAMIAVQKTLEKDFPNVRMLLQIHDELVFEAPEKDAERLKDAVRAKMEGAASLNVPLIADIGVGKNWGDAH